MVRNVNVPVFGGAKLVSKPVNGVESSALRQFFSAYEVYGMKAGSLDAQMAEPHEGQGWRQTQRVTMSKHAWETVSQ